MIYLHMCVTQQNYTMVECLTSQLVLQISPSKTVLFCLALGRNKTNCNLRSSGLLCSITTLMNRDLKYSMAKTWNLAKQTVLHVLTTNSALYTAACNVMFCLVKKFKKKCFLYIELNWKERNWISVKKMNITMKLQHTEVTHNRTDQERQCYCHINRGKGSHRITLYSKQINKNNILFIISSIITYNRCDLCFLVGKQCLTTIFTHKNTGISCFTPGLRPWKSCANQNRANQTQNSHLKQYISWCLGYWQPHPI